MRRVALGLACAVMSGCTAQQAPQATSRNELADALAGRIAGKPIDCIDNSQTSTVRIVAPDTVLYSATGRTIYRNTVENCPSLRPYSTIITRQYGSQLCRNDFFRVAEPGLTIPSGFCRLSAFVPYTKPDAR